MVAKRKSSEGTPAQRKKAAAEAARAEPESEEEEAAANGGNDDALEGAPPCSMATRDRLAKEMARMLLFAEHTKKGVTRAEIKKAAMADVKDSRGKIFDYAFAHANEMLRSTFGFEIAPSTAKAAPQPEADAGGSTQGAGTQAAEGEEKSAPPKYFLVSALERKPPSPSYPDKEEALYRALVLVVVGIIRFSSNNLVEEKLWECLRVLGMDKDEKRKLHKFGGSLEDLVLKRMVKDMYIHVAKGNSNEGSRKVTEGVRAKTEIKPAKWSDVLARIGVNAPGASQLSQPSQTQSR